MGVVGVCGRVWRSGARRKDPAWVVGDDCRKEGDGNGLNGNYSGHCGKAVPGGWTRSMGAADLNLEGQFTSLNWEENARQ